MFQAHAIESRQAQQLKNELIEFEADLFTKKQQHVLTYTNKHGEAIEASLPELSSTIRANNFESDGHSEGLCTGMVGS